MSATAFFGFNTIASPAAASRGFAMDVPASRKLAHRVVTGQPDLSDGVPTGTDSQGSARGIHFAVKD
jgi:hypothetical protein